MVYNRPIIIMAKNSRWGCTFIIGIIFAFVCGWFIKGLFVVMPSNPVEVRADSNLYKFINPLFFYKNRSETELDPLKEKLNKYITDQKKNKNAQEISVYFRDMNTGSWTGVNESEPFDPASMLKVAFMMSYLKRAEDDPSILQKKFYYNASDRDTASFNVASDNLPSGYYTVNDLINYMIVYSDNAALAALYSNDNGSTDKIYEMFQLPITSETSSTTDYMSTRTYSRIFRILYDGTFISWGLSEQALKILSLTTYKDGIQKAVPEDITVSHKFGERTKEGQYGNIINRELHDCGIVYKEKSPYFICVMTRGDDILKLQNIIQEISKLVYVYRSSK